MAIQVKVCGITRTEDAEVALSLGSAYIGINAYEKSPRSVPYEQIPQILEAIPRGKRILVDVAPSVERLRSFMNLGFDACQIHFTLDISMASVAGWSQVAGQNALWVAPKIPPSQPQFPQILMEFADTILLDAYDKDLYGGTGHAGENWQRFLDCSILYQHKRWILAGGLSPDNILNALQHTQAQFVDVASGVEKSPGIKDARKLREFFENISRFQ